MMGHAIRRTSRAATIRLCAAALASCGLAPRGVGPNRAEILEGSVQRQGDAFVVDVTPRVAKATAHHPAFGSSAPLRDASAISPDAIRPGDTLSLVIYENVEDGLLAGAGEAAPTVGEVQVVRDGFVFVPYAGRVRAAGNTPEALRRIVTDRPEEQTPDPQVVVRRVAGDGATVSVVGLAGAQGV